MATLKVSDSVPAPSDDAEQLRTAFEGWGTNEDLIISILAHRSAEQHNPKIFLSFHIRVKEKNLK
jgi:hypothetical protein